MLTQNLLYMGKVTGFREYKRINLKKESPESRKKHYKEFDRPYDEEEARLQGARCMECGVPFCHSNHGCPVQNVIPDFNDLVYRGNWKAALTHLHATNNFPELTGRLCPAPCESACTLGLVDQPVSIRAIERTIIQRGFQEGWVEPLPPRHLTGKRIAVVGSGPAGLAAAQQLARAGHRVVVFEKNDRIGGLVRYGIPDFKLEKWIIDRRLEQMRIEGVEFRTGVDVGIALPLEELQKEFDSIVLAMGSESPRDLPIPGRELTGVHFALEYLIQQNHINAGDAIPESERINAKDLDVLVIGGGDTGSDCVGTANRQGAKRVTQIEILPMPPSERDATMPWPTFPRILRTSTSHEEGVERKWSLESTEFVGDDQGHARSVKVRRVEFQNGKLTPVKGSEDVIKADLVLLAMGFLHPRKNGLIEALQKQGLELDNRGNVATQATSRGTGYATSVPGVYACGDTRRGQSLIVWAIQEGRRCAAQVNSALKGIH